MARYGESPLLGLHRAESRDRKQVPLELSKVTRLPSAPPPNAVTLEDRVSA